MADRNNDFGFKREKFSFELEITKKNKKKSIFDGSRTRGN